MLMKRGPLCFGVALLALACQFAVAVHEPLHAEEAASACSDRSSHFCAEASPEHPGPCILCQVNLSGLLELQPAHVEAAVPAALVESPEAIAPRSSTVDPSAPPRAPPVG